MNLSFYFRFALSGIWKNRQIFIPYLLTGVVNVSLFYMLMSLVYNPQLADVYGGDAVTTMLSLGVWVVGIFSAIFLFYSNSFLIKRRKKEFGLYSVLGMGKKQLAGTLFCEFLCTTAIALLGGLLLGILLSRLTFLLLIRLMSYTVILKPAFSWRAIAFTAEIFGGIFLISFLIHLLRVSVSRPIELVRGSNTGEKEPRTKWILVVIGVLSLGAGYAIALSQRNALEAMNYFFLAVLLVILGTYCLFIAVSVAILKFLRKRKAFYYRADNFTAISGMLYRMKQNGVGLASICILSTMVLLTVATTLSLFAGMQDVLKNRFPVNLNVTMQRISEDKKDEYTADIRKVIEDAGISPEGEIIYSGFTNPAEISGENVKILTDANLYTMSMVHFIFMTDSEYAEATGTAVQLEDGTAILESSDPYLKDKMTVSGVPLQIINSKDKPILSSESITITTYTLVLTQSDFEKVVSASGIDQSRVYYVYETNLTGTKAQGKACADALEKRLSEISAADGCSYYVDSQAATEEQVHALYGSLFFIGIFLGIVFLLGTVLIIYYKQISEGYDDEVRFSVMRKVGMSDAEIRGTIHRQIVMVFFLPLLIAVIHILVAFRYMTQILKLMGLANTSLFLICTAICLLVFAVVYGVVYLLTARAYYRIVRH